MRRAPGSNGCGQTLPRRAARFFFACGAQRRLPHPSWAIENTSVDGLPSGYLFHSHGKSPFLKGKPSISMGHLYHGYVSHNQRVILKGVVAGLLRIIPIQLDPRLELLFGTAS